MHVYLTLKMDREFDMEKHTINLGGCYVKANEKEYCLDFQTTSGLIDKNPTIIHFHLKNESLDVFPNMKEICNHLHEINEISKFYINTGDEYDNEINPIALLAFVVVDEEAKDKECPKSSEYVKCEKTEEAIKYVFQKKLFESFNNFVS